MKFFSKFWQILIVPLAFFVIAFLTLGDYGINWDEPIHFNRGQSYLYLFLTRTTDNSLPLTDRPSFFSGYDLEALFDWDGGHPPASDILSAFTNFIFYQKLGLLGDIASYHLFNILTGALLILVVAFFAYKVYGVFASIVASLTLATYPLFFSEAHFNIKDPPEAAFFGLTIFAFWLSLSRGNWRWLLVAAVSWGLALGTKFNAVFLPLVILPYLFVTYYSAIRKGAGYVLTQVKRIPPPYQKLLVVSPFISFTIFFVMWPFLWQDPLENILKVLHFYKDIGTGFNYQTGQYLVNGFNLYPVFWILITTPPFVLFLTGVGIIFALLKPDARKTTWLWLFWFIVPITRVSLPNTSIYGGVRQIMEFLPAMALLAGVAGYYLYKLCKTKLTVVILLVGFVPHLFVLAKLHPNENVYFNSFVGGLPGAKAKEIPSWGNSYGNAYWQAIQWINKNAEGEARLSLVQGTGQNVPGIQLRSDINFSNTNWSGINRNGEYLMELVYDNSVRAYPYAWEYIEKFLIPVYEVRVDGVTIAKVWKNDIEHTKPEWQKQEVLYKEGMLTTTQDEEMTLELKDKVVLSRLVIISQDNLCSKTSAGIQTSIDGMAWLPEPDSLPTEQVLKTYNFQKDSVDFYFPGRSARFVKLIHPKNSPCFSSKPKIDLLILE